MTESQMLYKKVKYTVRIINNLSFASTKLQNILIDPDTELPVDDEAEGIDNEISGYVSEEDLHILSDVELWGKFNSHSNNIAVEGIPGAVEDLTDKELNEWFITLSNDKKFLALRKNPKGNWLHYTLPEKILMFNTVMAVTKEHTFTVFK